VLDISKEYIPVEHVDIPVCSAPRPTLPQNAGRFHPRTTPVECDLSPGLTDTDRVRRPSPGHHPDGIRLPDRPVVATIERAGITVADVGSSTERWRESVERNFRFLADRGFALSEVDDSSPWETWVEYRSDRAAVRISRSNEFARAEVNLIRLVDGAVPPYPVWITAARIDWALLDNLLEARSPTLLGQARALSGLDDDSLERQLAFWATALQEAASDFLDGDLSPIDEAGAVVRERVRRNPQHVTAWLAEDAPPAREAETLQELSRTVPPEVGVTSRRYRREKHDR
jgi:hypothetical protein